MALVFPNSDPLETIRLLSADLRLRAERDPMLDLLPFGLAIARDRECREIRVNRPCAAMLGIDVTRNVSMGGPESEGPPLKVYRDGRELTADELPMQQAAARGVEVRASELDVVRPDGTRATLYVYAAPLFDDAGAPQGAIGVFVDITERRRVEQEQRFLAEASGILSSSLDYEHTLRDLAHLAVPVFGDYCAIDVNREDGTFQRVEFVIHDPSRREAAAVLRTHPPVISMDSPAAHAIRTGTAVITNDCTADVLARTAQNRAHLDALQRFGVTSFMMVPLRARGRTLGLITAGSVTGRRYGDRDVALVTDVAGRAALAIDNALLYRHAQEANRLKDEFLATLSHELRTPLNALLGWTKLLQGHSLDDAARHKALESIERNARAQAVLINDLLDVSRIVTGKLRLEEHPVDIAAVVASALEAIRPAARAKEIALSVSGEPPASEVIGDEDRLRQIVWNLLVNAVKFTPAGGRVDVSVQQPAGAVQIVVADTGSGIDPHFLPYVFERFRQGDSSTTRTQGGLGLGLAIVRNLADLHGGTVTAESEGAGKGSRFTLTLPTRNSLAAALAEPEPPVARSLEGARVLAVDDDEDSRELILLTLRAAGAEVMVVSSAASALEAIETFAPDVVMSDIAMPGTDGYTLMRQITQRYPAPPPAISLSAYATPSDEQLALDAGFTMHFGKPADVDRLVTAIAALVRPERQAG